MNGDECIYAVVVSDSEANSVRNLYSQLQSLDADYNDASDFDDTSGMDSIGDQMHDIKRDIINACRVNFGVYFVMTDNDKSFRHLASQAWYTQPVKTFVQKMMDDGLWLTELKPHKGKQLVLIPIRTVNEKKLLADLEYHVNTEAMLEDAQDAFWHIVAAAYPLAKSGDFPPDATFDFDDACEKAAGTWAKYNVPKE
jgi:hypothetical protein